MTPTSTTTTATSRRQSTVNFSAAAKAIRWLKNAPGVEDQNIQMAKKFMDITSGVKTESVEYNQAKCTNTFNLSECVSFLNYHLLSDLGCQ